MTSRRELLFGAIGILSTAWAPTENIINVTSFGAKFDGNSDDAGAIQAALDKAGEYRGATVALPPGTALISSPLRVQSFTKLMGVGSGTTLKAAPGLNKNVIENSDERGGEYVIISDLSIDGNEREQSPSERARGIYLQKVSHLHISNVAVYNTVDHCIHISNAGSETPIDEQRIFDCYLHGAGKGQRRASSGLAVSRAYDVKISRVISRQHERAGFRLQVVGTCTLEDCEATECGDGGFVPVARSKRINFRRCKAISNGHNGCFEGFRFVGLTEIKMDECLSAKNRGAGVLLLNGCRGVAIQNSKFVDNGQEKGDCGKAYSKAGVAIASTGKSSSAISLAGVVSSNNKPNLTQDYGLALVDPKASSITLRHCDLSGNTIDPLLNHSDQSSEEILSDSIQ